MWKSLAIIGGVEAALEQVRLDLSKKIVIYRLQINVPHPLHLSHTIPYHTISYHTISWLQINVPHPLHLPYHDTKHQTTYQAIQCNTVLYNTMAIPSLTIQYQRNTKPYQSMFLKAPHPQQHLHLLEGGIAPWRNDQAQEQKSKQTQTEKFTFELDS